MSTLFENIVRELILELSADDAYTKFYSSLAKSVYDTLMEGVPNITPFHTLALNCFVNDKDSVGLIDLICRAREINSMWHGLDTNRKRELLNKSKKEKSNIKTVDSVLNLISKIDSSDEFKSKNNVSSEGYIVVYENDNVLVTCTTTYMANNHYFGHTKWCTASDLGGRYNGYYQFLNYTRDSKCLLQFKFKTKFLATNAEHKSNLYQASVRKEGIFYACCNEFDEPCSIEYDESGLSDDEFYYNITTKLQGLIKETERQAPIEREYIQQYVNKTIDSIYDNMPKQPSPDDIINYGLEKIASHYRGDVIDGKFIFEPVLKNETCLAFGLNAFRNLSEKKQNFVNNTCDLYSGKHIDLVNSGNTVFVFYVPENKFVCNLQRRFFHKQAYLADNTLIYFDNHQNSSYLLNLKNGKTMEYNHDFKYRFRVNGGVILSYYTDRRTERFLYFDTENTKLNYEGVEAYSRGSKIHFTKKKGLEQVELEKKN